MGKKGGASAPAPDPNIGAAALKQAETGQQWLDFSKEAFAVSQERQKELDEITKRIADQQIAQGEQQFAWAKSDRERYEQVFKPLEDEFIKEASDYATPERQAAAAAEARADVLSAAGAERDAARREAMSLGISPTSGRYAGIERAGELGTALGAAGAANAARTAVRDKGLALKADVANLGRGLPTQSAQAASLGLSAGSSAAGLYGNANQQYLASTGIMGQGYKGAMAGYAGMGDTLNRQYATQVDAWKAQQAANAQASSGLWSGIGSLVGGVAGIFASDEKAKTNKEEIPEGEALDAVRASPAEAWDYKPGVADEGRHIGPYAQDVAAATGKGDGKTIAVQDMLGLHHKAIEDLDRKVDRIATAVGIRSSKKPPAANKTGGRSADVMPGLARTRKTKEAA
ncbi:tail fiber domain-containing protein [Chelatococcus sp. XZ-Ab1]|uniref:tail fiber domain-containing protein n=1 Tax=Chelatococcus sp. XZ-Ab1 TaxID=3034027 RepID=UPI0023E4431E|nr:tail fiber domain-containing protein [Chelatococcus sp. XZ-Ab1]